MRKHEGDAGRRAQKRTSFFRAGAVVEADAGEIGRDEGRWICEPSPVPVLPPLVPPPGTGHSCEERFVEAAKSTKAEARLSSSHAFETAGEAEKSAL